MIVTHIPQRLRQSRSVPLSVAFRRELIQQAQHTPFGFLRTRVRFT